MSDSWLYEALYRKGLTVGDCWVYRQRHELWVTVQYMKLSVSRDLNCVGLFMTKGRTAIYRCTAQQTLHLCTSSKLPLQYNLHN